MERKDRKTEAEGRGDIEVKTGDTFRLDQLFFAKRSFLIPGKSKVTLTN